MLNDIIMIGVNVLQSMPFALVHMFGPDYSDSTDYNGLSVVFTST